MPKYSYDKRSLESILDQLEYQFIDNVYFVEAVKKFRKDGDISDLVKYLKPNEVSLAEIYVERESSGFYAGTINTFFYQLESNPRNPSSVKDPDNYKTNGDLIKDLQLNIW